MDLFARCFLLVFEQIFIGGMIALCVPPFQDIERGFYKSTASVFVGSGILAFTGRMTLAYWPTPGARAIIGSQALELALFFAALVAASVYLRSLWGSDSRLRARSYITSWIAGFFAICAAAQSFGLEPGFSLESVLFPLNLMLGALVLGGVCTGMLLGHWYLIDSGLSLEPFNRIFRFFAWTLVLQAGVLLLTMLLLSILGQPTTQAALQRLWGEHSTLVLGRWLVSPLTTAALAWMIWKTLQIPQTMAATGLFYVAILSVLVGEFLGRFILFRTGLPL